MKEKMKHNYKNNLILALGPMAGFTDAPFRGICSQFGANSTITEMVSAMGLLNAPKDGGAYKQLLFVNENEKNCSAQIFGSNTQVCADAAKLIADMNKFTYIDINMGCPVKKIVGNGE
ncbi:MAG: tRNA dihydrouridine synthase DusB, partial [Christensenellaceae bacterium]|nr:tRNA dihydrouridine synthase DusB [Christensenellaceae bacterium]